MSSSIVKKVPRRSIFGSNKKKDDNDKCKERRLPSTVPIVGLGCSSFSTFFWTLQEQEKLQNIAWLSLDGMKKSNPIVQEWIQTIHYAILDCGITLLDTAPWYGHGTSEIVIGWALQDILLFDDNNDDNNNNNNDNNNNRNDDNVGSLKSCKIQRSNVTINTKVGRYNANPSEQFDFSKHKTIQSVQSSLERLQCQYIDVLQLHDPEFAPTLSQLLNETIPAMLHCQSQGYCKALGMTGYPLHVQHLLFQSTMEKYNQNIWDQALTYSHYNLHTTSLFHVMDYNDNKVKQQQQQQQQVSFADYCQQYGIALLAAAPLSMGLLTHEGPPEWHPASAELKQACQEAANICQQHHVNIATLAITFAMASNRIPCTILGMKNKQQVDISVEIANRFHAVKDNQNIDDSHDNSSTVMLHQVLTDAEFKVLKLIQDKEKGPFATVWANGNYEWDGVQEAKTFWKQLPNITVEEWQHK